jgi:hypothetical protein
VTPVRDHPARAEPVQAGPIVVLGFTADALGLVQTLAEVAPRAEGPAVVAVGLVPAARMREALPAGLPATVRYVSAPAATEDIDGLVRALTDEVDVASARAIVVRPDLQAKEPDASSRVTCMAVGRACGARPVPNVLVEVRDPEAAYEFAGLGVATVFYPGYLRAALLAHACVDLGVFQFVFGLLRGRYRVRLHPVPDALREGTFADAVRTLEEDDQGRPLTVVGIQLQSTDEGSPAMIINPGPRRSLRGAVGVLVLGDG